jgi:hypothetical protein
MLPLSLASINEARLLELCESECQESQTLEFKRELPGKQDQDKHEICKDVVALANTEGGDLVYGIEEKDGVAGTIVGIITESADAAIRRINQVLDAGIEPRIHGLRIQQIPVSEGYVLILRVPASYDGPHCIRTNSNNKQQRRFVMRNGTMVSDMSYDQIRGAFDRTATLAEQARRFIATRRELIAKGETPVPLMSGPQLVVHLVPISGLAGRMTVDLRQIKEKDSIEFHRYYWDCSRSIFNLDGLVFYPSRMGKDGYSGYNHIFRTVSLESVEIRGSVQKNSQDNEMRIVSPSQLSRFFYQSAKKSLEKVKSWGFTGPSLLGFSILNVKDYELEVGDINDPFRLPSAADRPHLTPSEVWIEDIDTVDIDSVIRPLLDTLWQAFGIERCPYFDDVTGKFAPRQR